MAREYGHGGKKLKWKALEKNTKMVMVVTPKAKPN